LIVVDSHTRHASIMRTNIEIDDELMAQALELSGLRTKRAVVDAALRALIDRISRRQLKEAFGKYPWEGNLAQLRRWRGDEPR
jgi:Arc/MetJ family transcription regulator